MNKSNVYKLIGALLVISSALFYYVHYLVFNDLHHILIFMMGDLAFVPIEVLLVSLIIHRLLNDMEKNSRLEKLNMVIGLFFSELGTGLLAYLSDFDPKLDIIKNDLIVTDDWSDKEFMDVRKRLRNYDYMINIQDLDIKRLENLLFEQRDFLVWFFLSSNIREHESFNYLLHAVFHLTEELSYRDDLNNPLQTDYEHLTSEIEHIYPMLVYEWLDYMRHLKNNYPGLFSLAMRTNPFDKRAAPLVKKNRRIER